MSEKNRVANLALEKARRTLEVFDVKIGEPTSYYLRRSRRGAVVLVRQMSSTGGCFNLNLSLATGVYPATFAKAREWMRENYGSLPEIPHRRNSVRLRLVK